MGFLDNVTSVVNRGTASVQRGGRSVQLKMQLNELVKERRDLAAQLGASLYNAVKDNEELREGREPLFDGIAAIDQRRATIEAEIEELEAAAAAQAAARETYICPSCSTTVAGDDLFCSGCGMPIAEVKAAQVQQSPFAQEPAASMASCAACGEPMAAGDMFCMHCGAKVGQASEPVPATMPAPEPASAGSAPTSTDGAPAAGAPVPAPKPVGASASAIEAGDPVGSSPTPVLKTPSGAVRDYGE